MAESGWRLAVVGWVAWAAWAACEAGKPVRLAQQPGNVLVDFLAYRHVAIVHFDVPINAVSVGFKFTAKEEKIGGIGECHGRDVTINLKPGSLAVVRPDDSRIEAKLLKGRRRHYTIEASSNGDEHIVNIVAPSPGDWFAIAYRSWVDPDSGKIQQQGLSTSCETRLDAELWVEMADEVLELGEWSSGAEQALELAAGSSAAVQLSFGPSFGPSSRGNRRLSVESSCGEQCAVAVHVTASQHLAGRVVNSAGPSLLEFRPLDDGAAHSVVVRLDRGPGTNLTLRLLEPEPRPADEPAPLDQPLTRTSLPDFFLFDFELLGPAANGSAINGSASGPAKPEAQPVLLPPGGVGLLRFRLGPVYDTGGSLSIGLKLPERDPLQPESVVRVVVGCVNLGYPADISETGQCERSGPSSPSEPDLLLVERLEEEAFVHAPFPEPGVWQLSARAFCAPRAQLERQPECANASQCLDELELAACPRASPVRISIGSSPCIEGHCSGHGRCVHYFNAGFVYSGCHCSPGYRGFDCADDSRRLPPGQLLARLLMLTLSNAAFASSVFVAVRSKYYSEAVVYAAVLFFSTFYHACEAGEEGPNFCLLKLNVLQFCDFYNALLSIWVTLVAMASLGPRATSFAQMLGVVVLALGAEMDRTALWVFLLPSLAGSGLVLVSWSFRCRQKGTIRYPARIYRFVYLPIGLLVVFVGLLCYAFLQTRSNYYIVHSVWHICVATGVVFLLPKPEYME